MDKTIGIAELRNSIASVINEVHEDGAQYIVLQRSKAKAVILSPEALETLEVMADKELMESIREAEKDIKNGRVVSYEEYYGKKLPQKPVKKASPGKPTSKSIKARSADNTKKARAPR